MWNKFINTINKKESKDEKNVKPPKSILEEIATDMKVDLEHIWKLNVTPIC